jgi:hypothetical protein
MSAEELENWLKTGDSESSGWKNSSDDTETVGHESGTKILDILKRNPKKDEDKYTDEDLAHMRKVCSTEIPSTVGKTFLTVLTRLFRTASDISHRRTSSKSGRAQRNWSR